LLVLVVRIAGPHVHFATIGVPLTCIQAYAMLCFDLLCRRIVHPLLVLVVHIAAPHEHFSTTRVQLTGVQAQAMRCFDQRASSLARGMCELNLSYV